ncbi:TetR/AcrR family transcriptional regulator [Herbiconiux sp. SYSU D00978]|uniref:TetR/AcrR family transcriptional regulator n=1 Tax=Herbiconiux sp. SYSU D00978 TaxID=2812562 RepID=UPI001A963201|nr:TetR/AcrR family transcriptional regulator [Herbiconiux sp. SYSU D00978]
MAQRGSYAKGVAKREEILTTALDVIARNGWSGATVKELSEAVGLSQAGLLHYFGSKEELYREVLRRRDELDRQTYDVENGTMPEGLVRLVGHNAEVPGLVQLFARFSVEAAEPGHAAHEFFEERYRVARETTAERMRQLQQSGELPADLDPEKLAVILFALIDGLQVQWMYEPGIDMAEHVDYLWRVLRTAGGAGA